MPALLTPFDRNGRILTDSVAAVVNWQIKNGADGFYVCGHTGEGPILTTAQRREMAEAVIAACDGRAKVIVHTGSINNNEMLELTRHAEQAGADAVSSVPPYFFYEYNLKEIVEYYKCMAACTSLPVLLYATSSLAGLDVNAMLKELLCIDNIIGLKDTRAKFFEMWKLREMYDEEINIINGPDEMLICGLCMGADGGIGSTYNIMIDQYAALYQAFRQHDIELARRYQTRINRVIKTLCDYSCGGNIIGLLKAYLTASGFDMGYGAAFPAIPVAGDFADRLKNEIDQLLREP